MEDETMTALTRKDNIPFIVKDCEETRKILNTRPSKKMIEEGKRSAAHFETANALKD